jgi:hypothetical protein
MMGGCPGLGGLPALPVGVYNNTTDPTNNNASYIGSAACRSCHPSFGDQHELHGHASGLKRILGTPPSFPPQASRAGVPDPPAGRTWGDISYVIGGFSKGANFVDLDGFILTNGLAGVDTQWNLSFPPNGTTPSFASYLPAAAQPTPLDYSCFRCHTTGAREQDPANPMFQDNRPGIPGTWHAEGVQCETCHGPGSNHAPAPFLRNNYVNSSAFVCGQCHSSNNDSSIILATDGFIDHSQQWSELKASGGHKDFSCTYCHDPHAGTSYSTNQGIRNACTACHSTQNMALHDGKVLTRGDYSETLTCMSCHMTFATRTSSTADASTVGALARMGDTKTHIFRIASGAIDFTSFFSADGKSVAKDADGRAAVTVDFVCLRCHNGNGAFMMTVAQAADKVLGLHQDFSTSKRKNATTPAP